MSKVMRKEKEKRNIKKRFVFLHIVALAMILFFIMYIDVVGDRYDVHTTWMLDEEQTERITVKFKPDIDIEIIDIWRSDDGEAIVTLESDEEYDDTKMTITLHDEAGGEVLHRESDLHITVMGTIVEKGEYFTNFNGYQLVSILFLAMLLMILCVMVFSFAECYRKRDFCYQMVAYGGVAIYLAIQIAIIVYKILNNVVNSFSALVALVMQTGQWFITLLAPFLLVMAIALSVSNIWLMRHEGFRPANAQGIIISVIWLIGVAISLNLGVFKFYLVNSAFWDMIHYLLTFVITYFECMLISTSVCAFLASRCTPPLDRDFIIILGCAIRSDGSLTPLLKGRADAAVQFEKRQCDETGKRACFVPSGGQGSDEIISEGEAMERYLISQGIEAEQIRREDRSVNTFENMKFSKEVIVQNTGDIAKAKIAFATTNYHVFRGYILAQKNGFQAQGIAAKTKWYFFPNAFIREFIGLLADQIGRHIVIIGFMILVLIGVTYLL